MTINKDQIAAARAYYVRMQERLADYQAKRSMVDEGCSMADYYHEMIAMQNAQINGVENLTRRLGLYSEICKGE